MNTTLTESTNMGSWESAGWSLRSFNVLSVTETLIAGPQLSMTQVTEPDEPLFGVHVREAAQTLHRLLG